MIAIAAHRAACALLDDEQLDTRSAG